VILIVDELPGEFSGEGAATRFHCESLERRRTGRAIPHVIDILIQQRGFFL